MNLIQLKERAEEKNRIDKLLNRTQEELTQEEAKLIQLKKELHKEFEDVKRLEEGGLTNLFHELLGTREKKLDKERQEYLAAKLKYENCQKQIENLKQEVERLNRELQQCGNPENDYKALLSAKEQQLKVANDDTLKKYENELGYFFSQKEEVNEAINAGKMAIKGLKLALASLRKAQNWGTFDMVGGGLIATAVKHSKMDEAKALIHDVQYWLRKFNRELNDVQVNEVSTMDLQLDGLTTFADYFFDNLIMDWVVQSKINRSYDGCLDVLNQVSLIVKQLESADSTLTNKYQATKKELTDYLVQA
ncbi:hypothetical protein SLH46_14790 [Draconibacterium sp. IB214405]|uniref:hypothetical protein n=1 Tax=Draconibacterium sp. IB214405 TaxID=3097352 RepID=UPI002A135A1C|nr:hypothetical protein [Draconibacterium sp. IB214405]MDX8340467.1 hypothetical protein [Draconibacterium sp. IB214405]